MFDGRSRQNGASYAHHCELQNQLRMSCDWHRELQNQLRATTGAKRATTLFLNELGTYVLCNSQYELRSSELKLRAQRAALGVVEFSLERAASLALHQTQPYVSPDCTIFWTRGVCGSWSGSWIRLEVKFVESCPPNEHMFFCFPILIKVLQSNICSGRQQ